MKKISLVFILLLASAFSSHAMAMKRRQDQKQYPLHEAAEAGDAAQVQQLIEAGHDVNEKGTYGRTPLHKAAIKGHAQIATTLLAHPKIDPYIKDSYGETPLHWAALRGHVEVIRILLAHLTIDPNIKDNCGWTPLQLAEQEDSAESVALLCGIHGKALQQIEELSADNLERFFVMGNDLLLSYDLENLEYTRRFNADENTDDPCFAPIKKILDAAIEYKKTVEQQITEHATERSLSCSGMQQLPPITTPDGATRIPMPSYLMNFARPAAAAGHAHGAGIEDSADTDDEGEGEVADGDE